MRPVQNVFQKLSRTEQRREGVAAYLWGGPFTGSSGYMCVKGERVGENVYRVPGVCPLGSNDFEF